MRAGHEKGENRECDSPLLGVWDAYLLFLRRRMSRTMP
jgi:hypothetical protein